MHKLITYPNGLRLIVKKLDFVRSVTVGVWVAAGSAYETKANNGISHFIEHMMFKGTKTRTAFDIVDSIDSIGAQVNAFTAKECTCYYTKSTDEHAEKCVEILSDMLNNSVFDSSEAEREKKVVLEEISMTKDAPEEVCHELLAAAYFDGSPLGMTILGTEKSVKSIDREKIESYMQANYCPDRMVVSIAGSIDFDEADRIVKKYFETEGVCQKGTGVSASVHKPKQKIAVKKKQVEQASIAFSFPSIPFNDPGTYSLMLVNSVLGGGMSSRLFQKVREQKGLAYSVYSYMSAYKNNGIFSVYLGTNPANTAQAVETVMDEIRLLKREGITEQEFLRGKEQLKGAFILGQENTASIMNTYGKQLLMTGEIFDLDAKLNEIKSLDISKCRDMIDRVFDFNIMCAAMVSKDTKFDIKSSILQA